MADLSIVSQNVNKMIDAGAPSSDIDAYLGHEGYTADSFRQAMVESRKPKEQPSFLGDLGRSFMRGKQQLDIAGTVLGREFGAYSDEEAAKQIAKDTAEAAKYQPSQRLKTIQQEAEQDKSIGEVLKRYADRPVYDSLRYVLNLVAESAVPSIVAGGAGAAAGAVAGSVVPFAGTATGAAAGLGLGSGAIEYASTIIDRLSEAKVDVTDPKAVQAFLSDPEKMAEARKSGLLRGIPIGVIDAITAGAAGRFIAPVKAAEQAGKVVSRGTKAAAGAKELGLQMVGGAAGEAAAGVAEKGEINPKAVMDEAIAEIPSGIVETILGVRARGKRVSPNNPYSISTADVEEAIRSIKADNDKEIEAFDKLVMSQGIPADMQKAILELGDRVYSPATNDEEIAASIEDIKKKWPDYDGTLDALIPNLSKIRTRGDAVGKLSQAVEVNKKRGGKQGEINTLLSDLRDVFAQTDAEKAQEQGLMSTAGATLTEEEAASAEQQRQAYAKQQARLEASQRQRLTPESAVPMMGEEEFAATEAASREAQQNLDTASFGPYSVRENKRQDGTSVYQIVGENNKAASGPIETKSEAERRTAALNAEAAKQLTEEAPFKQAEAQVQAEKAKDVESTEKTAFAAAETLAPRKLTSAEQTVKAARETMASSRIPNARQIQNAARVYFENLKDIKNADPGLLQKSMEDSGVTISLERAREIIKDYSYQGKKKQKTELSIDNVFSSPQENASFGQDNQTATDIVNKFLSEMEGRGRQGQASAAALRSAIFGKDFNADQALAALKIVLGVERVMGKAAKDNPVAIRFLKEGESPAARTTIDDDTVNSVLEFSLAPDALAAAGQNYAHETMHVLQDLFKYVDPEAHKVLSRVFKKGMTVNDIPRNIVDLLKSRKNPYSGKSYWETMQPALEKADLNENELMAYTFGAVNEIMELNPGKMPPIGGVFTRFARFVGKALNSIRESLFGRDGTRALNIMKELSSGYRQQQFKEAPLKRMGETTFELRQPSELKVSEGINKDIVRMNSHLSAITREEGIKMSKNYTDYIKEFFNPYHMLGKGADKFRIARAMMTGDIAKITEGVDKLVKDIASSKEDKTNIFRYLTTKDASPSMIRDGKARAAAVETKRLINKIGDEFVKRKLITEAEREKYRDQYLHRTYIAYANKKKFVSGGHKPGFMYYLKSREELTPEQRASLGEIEDPKFLVQESLFAPMRDLAILNYFDKLNKLGNGSWILGMEKTDYVNSKGVKLNLSLPEVKSFTYNLQRQLDNGEISPDRVNDTLGEISHAKKFVAQKERELKANVDEGRYIQMPKDEERYGSLAGLWVSRPIYRDIMGVGSFLPNNMSGLAAIFADGTLMSKATSWFKLSKVALNPPTIATNIISNALMMHMADVPMHRILPNVAAAFKEIVIDKKGKYYDIAHKYGLKETTLSEAELRSLYKDLEKRKIGGESDLGKVVGMFRALGDSMSSGAERASAFYGGIETVFKTAIIRDAIENQGLSESEAVLKANKYLFDYSEVHDSIKVLRNMPFGAPFITWSYKMTPLLIETALTKPWKFLPYAMLFYGIGSMAAAAFSEAGGSDEDKERIKKYISKKTGESPFVMPVNTTDVVDFGKFMPFNNMYKFASEAAKGDIVAALKAFGFFGGPVADIVTFAMTGKDAFTGRDVVPKGATKEEKAIMIANHFSNVFMPPFMKDLPQFMYGKAIDNPELMADSQSLVADTLKKIFDAPTGKEAGLPTKSTYDLAKNFFGINTYHPSIVQFQKNILGMQREVNDIKAEMNSTLKDPSLSDAQKKKVIEKYSEMIKDKMKEIAEYVKDSNLSPSIYKIAQESVNGTRS